MGREGPRALACTGLTSSRIGHALYATAADADSPSLPDKLEVLTSINQSINQSINPSINQSISSADVSSRAKRVCRIRAAMHEYIIIEMMTSKFFDALFIV